MLNIIRLKVISQMHTGLNSFNKIKLMYFYGITEIMGDLKESPIHIQHIMIVKQF
jgi:hypothetical protein